MKAVYIVTSESLISETLVSKKIVSGVLSQISGRWILARYGTNKSELKKILKKEDEVS